MVQVTSPGHKLGQMIGNFFEAVFSDKLKNIAQKHGFYFDKKGSRSGVRGSKRKVTWVDAQGNEHDLDYVFERNGTKQQRGEPVAFVELAWRRYTKHSRNKAGEIEGALVPLGNKYSESCSFLGAILGGKFTDSSINQLESNRIHVLHIPYDKIVQVFLAKGVDLDYPQDASDEEKLEVIEDWEKLSTSDIEEIEKAFFDTVRQDYDEFKSLLENSLTRRVKKIRVSGLFGEETVFSSVRNAISFIQNHQMAPKKGMNFQKFEIYILFANGDKIDGSFRNRKEAIDFLEIFK